jgi:hypothetical protein
VQRRRIPKQQQRSRTVGGGPEGEGVAVQIGSLGEGVEGESAIARIT